MDAGMIDRGDGVRLAWRARAGRGPTLVFLPGYRSDMAGTKAEMLDAWAAANGRALLRLDYSGHGLSGGAFTDGSIGQWLADALAVIDACSRGKLLLVGSSMGGWIALLVALARPERVAGLVGIAAAPDFTEDLMWAAMAPPEQAALRAQGVLEVPSEYGEPLPITWRLIEEGRQHLLLRGPIPISVPVRLVQGQRDADVPWETALRLASRLTGEDVRTILVKDGDHRLSRPADLALLIETVAGLATLLGEDGGQALAEGRVSPGKPEG
jgi:pimeloyl-ACP methyl ester carboxylesterase